MAYKKKKLELFNIKLTISDLCFFYKQVSLNRSFMRSTHNLFLHRKINIKQNCADFGSGNKNDYFNFINKKKFKIDQFDLHKLDKNFYVLDLEKKFKLKKRYNHILLFNVLEHIYNKENLIKSLTKNLNKYGKLDIFVPFMFRYHSDPDDFFRPTHSYLFKILNKNGFKTKITLIAVGPMSVILEILFKYLKFKSLKFLVSILFILLNNFFKFFSKDFSNYYCGVHCSSIKTK